MSTTDERPYVIIRAKEAGVHAGYLTFYKGREVHLQEARRIWYWDGAFTLSALAKRGSTKPENCKFSTAIKEIKLLEACEIIYTEPEAAEQIRTLQEWEPPENDG